MIFPTDYRQRLIKQQKSRQYKAMLDQQIRQNHLYNQQNRKRPYRNKTQPIQSYHSRQYANPNKITSSIRQLPHQSTFLPSINYNNSTSNIIDHNYRYIPSSGYSGKKYFSSLPNRRQFGQKNNDQQLDDHLQKCLEQCDQLINGINKNFINLNNHIRSSKRRNLLDNKNDRNRNYSDFDAFKDQDSRFYQNHKSFDSNHKSFDSNHKSFDSHLPVTSLRGSQLISIDNDVGRNEMMNYNLLKSKQKQIFDQNSPKAKRKNLNEMIGNNIKSTPNKKSNGIDFDTIGQQNQFANLYLSQTKANQKSDSIQKAKRQLQAKKMEQQLKKYAEMKKKDTKLIEYLRKAKNRGNILFKKIQTFKKQRQQLDQLQQLQQISNEKNNQNPKSPNKSAVQSKNSQYQDNKSVQNSIKKQQVGLENKNTKQQAGKSPLNSKSNSKASQYKQVQLN